MITEDMIPQLVQLIMIGFAMGLVCWFVGWAIAKIWRMFSDLVRP